MKRAMAMAMVVGLVVGMPRAMPGAILGAMPGAIQGPGQGEGREVRREEGRGPLPADVLAAARSYADGGGYKWEGSGVPEEIRFGGERILAKSPAGTYCSGFTFAVAMKVGEEFGLFEGKSVEEIRRFQREWYGAVPETAEKQASQAMENLGVGGPVPAEEAEAGDFLQFWRGRSGHSVVFIGWVERDGRRVGIEYRSSQGATDGIGDHIEYFNDSGIEGGRVDPERIYFARFGGEAVHQ